MITEVYLETPEDLMAALNGLPNNYIFRGHANYAWKLESTLERVLGERWTSDLARKSEDFYLNLFKSKYHIYNEGEHDPGSKLCWLSIMQHYGAPTRLIDFTESPYVALYFALESYDPESKHDLAVYALDYSSVMDASLAFISRQDSNFSKTRAGIIGQQDEIFDNVVDRFSYGIVWVTEPLKLNARIDRQAGTFLISGKKEMRIEDLLSLEMYARSDVIKYRISHGMYKNIYALLRKMNINAKSIYGDLGGLAKSIRMDMQVHMSD